LRFRCCEKGRNRDNECQNVAELSLPGKFCHQNLKEENEKSNGRKQRRASNGGLIMPFPE